MLLSHELAQASGLSVSDIGREYELWADRCDAFQEHGLKSLNGALRMVGGLGGLSLGNLNEAANECGDPGANKAFQELEECRRRLVANGFRCTYTRCHLPSVGSMAWGPKLDSVVADLVVFAPPALLAEGFRLSPFIIQGDTYRFGDIGDAALMFEAFLLGFSLIPRERVPYWVDDFMLSREEVELGYVAPQAVFILKNRKSGWYDPYDRFNVGGRKNRVSPKFCQEFRIGHAVMHRDYKDQSNQDMIGLYMGDHKVYSPDWYSPLGGYNVGAANYYDLGSKTGHR